MPTLDFKVNGRDCRVEVEIDSTLLQVLRDELRITGPKAGCNTGDCGACSVLLDGILVRACITNALSVRGREVITVEGLARHGELHPLQKAFQEHYGSQCGFCTPGMLLAAKALLDRNPTPSVEEVKESISGNLCRCTGYVKIIDSIVAASREMAKREAG